MFCASVSMIGSAVSEPPPRAVVQMGCAFKQARMQVEDVARKRFASGRTSQQQGQLAIGARMMGEVVVDDQHVATRFHEMLGDAGRGIRRDVGQTRRLVALGHHHDRVFHALRWHAGWPPPWPPPRRAGRSRSRRR